VNHSKAVGGEMARRGGFERHAAFALAQVEVAELDPARAPHRLVEAHARLAARVPHHVVHGR
jgi:hypothetical protein